MKKEQKEHHVFIVKSPEFTKRCYKKSRAKIFGRKLKRMYQAIGESQPIRVFEEA